MKISTNASSFNSLLQLSSTSSHLTVDQYCFISRPSSFIFTAFYITNILLLLPLIVLVLYYAVRKWQNHSVTSASTLSHSDCFTYHMVIMEIFGALRGLPYCVGIYKENLISLFIGGLLSSFIWYGETFLHVLTCVERYLAVVHPITYRGLRNARGIRIRNTSIGCVWLLSFVRMGLFLLKLIVIDFCLLVLLIFLIVFCSLSVLCVLVHPGPGKRGKESIDQSKKRAFYTILAILGVLMFRFVGSLTWNILFVSEGNDGCLIMSFIVWFNLPTSLVLPLLFLHRKGTFSHCRKKCSVSIQF